MYHWVKDKEYLKQSYSVSADLVNQLVQHLKHYEIEASMYSIGSARHNMVTQNDNEPIDFDFNLLIENGFCYNGRKLKETVREAFNEILERNGLEDCDDSTSVLTTKKIILKGKNKTAFSVDVGIVSFDSFDRLHRLIHNKSGWVQYDTFIWNEVPQYRGLNEKENAIKPDYWQLVREKYLEKKNLYLSAQDNNHPSFVCYIEAVNEVYANITTCKRAEVINP